MKKFFAILGGIVAATSVIAIAAVILKKIKLSFCIESADDDFDFESDASDDISISIDDSTDDADEDDALDCFDIDADESVENAEA